MVFNAFKIILLEPLRERNMPKMKTKRAAAKRFSVTGTGKFKRRRKGLRHILEKKPHKVKKRNGKADYVHCTDVNNVTACLPYYKKM